VDKTDFIICQRQGFLIVIESSEAWYDGVWNGFVNIIKENVMATQIRAVLSSDSITGTAVQNISREDLGEIKSLMIDISEGKIAYAVLSFGGFLGMGDKLFAIPWKAFQVVQEEKVFLLDVSKEILENAPGFDKDNWPDMADVIWGQSIHKYYGYDPYWD